MFKSVASPIPTAHQDHSIVGQHRGIVVPRRLAWMAALFISIGIVPWGFAGEATKSCYQKSEKTCPLCPTIPACVASSMISSSNQVFIHDAIDYQVFDAAGAGTGGCAPCGGVAPSSPGNPLKHLEIKRLHRYRSIGSGGSLGVGGYLTFDKQIALTKDTGNVAGNAAFATYFDPAHVSLKLHFSERDNGDATIDGVLHDGIGQFKELRLLAADGSLAPDWTLAVTAVLIATTGEQSVFEVMRTDPSATSTARSCRLIKEIDRNGNTLTIAYVYPVTATDATLGNDRVRLWQYASVTDHYAHQATFTWSTTRNGARYAITQIALPNSTVVKYRYNTTGGVTGISGINLIGVDHPDGAVSSFSYSYDTTEQKNAIAFDDHAAGGTHQRKTAYVTGNQFVNPDTTTITQAIGQVTKVVDGLGQLKYRIWSLGTGAGTENTRLIYIASEGLFRYKTSDYAANVTSYERALSYDLSQPEDTYVFEAGETYGNDAGHELVTKVTDAASRVTNTTYDTKTRAPLTITHPDGTTTTRTYNGFNQPLTEIDRLGRLTIFAYDAKGNLTSKKYGNAALTPSEQSEWKWSYNARGQTLSATDANLNVTSYAYDAQGYLTGIVDPKDDPSNINEPVAQRTFAYNTTIGLLTSSADADGRTVTYQYDNRNRLVKRTYADTSFEQITYGSTAATRNLVVSTQDRNLNLTTYEYDGTSRLVKTTFASGKPESIVETIAYLPGTTDIRSETVRAGEKTIYNYDHRRRLVATNVQARVGKILTTGYAYDALNRRAIITDAYGRRTFQVYDPKNSWVVRVVRELVVGGVPANSVIATLSRVTTPNPPYIIEDSTYDAEGQVASRIDGRGITDSFAYDSQGRLKQQLQASAVPAGLTALSYKTVFDYDAQGNRTKITHPRTFTEGSTFATTMTYTGRNLLKSTTEAIGRSEAATRSGTYTKTRKKASDTDAMGAITTYAYHTCCDRLKDVIEPGGAKTTYGYDHHGNVTSVTDPNGNTTTTHYDGRHRVDWMTNAENEKTTYTYDDNCADGLGLDADYPSYFVGLNLGVGSDGSAVLVTNALTETSMRIQDGLGRQVRTVDGNANKTTVLFDTVNASLVQTEITDPALHTTRARADAAGRVRASEDGENRKSLFAYDANGNRVSVRDPNNVGQDCIFDAANRDVQCTDTASAVTKRTYNAHGSVVTTTDALGKITTCVFDGRERKTSCTDRIAGVTTFAYDKNNNLLKITDAEARVTDYGYDARNLLVSEIYPPGEATPTAGTDKRTYAYDAGRRLKTRTDQTGAVTTYAYDKANRLTERQYPDALNDAFVYDDASRLKTATSGRFSTTVARSYDVAGRLTSEIQTVGGYPFTVGYGYDADNLVTRITYPNGKQVLKAHTTRHQLASVSYDGSAIASRVYDIGGRFTTTTYGNAKVETRTYQTDNTVGTLQVPGVTNFSYTYDLNKRKTYEGHQFPEDLQTFGYDAENRVTTWTRDGKEDQNWTLTKVGDWASTTRNGVTETRTHSPVHEVLTTTTAGVASNLDWDKKGNLSLDRNGQRYDWDVENRLIASVTGAATSGYAYDALGRRLAKVASGKVTTFVHDGAQVIAEYETPVYQSADIGAPALAGSFSDPGTGTITLAGGGVDIWGTSDQLRYAYGQMTGNGTLIARITSQTNTNAWAKAGLMFRTSLAADAQNAAVLLSPSSGVTFQRRATVAATTVSTVNAGITGPVWLKLTRSGTLITAERSADGIYWTVVGTDTVAFPATPIYVGLAVTSHNAAALSTVTFTNVAGSGNFRTTASPIYARGYVYGSYVDELLAILPASGLAADRKFVHSNHLYSVAALTDNSGNVVERYRYDAYGQRLVVTKGADNTWGTSDDGTTANSAFGNQYGFTGRYLDKETGLYYYRTRYHSPTLGRFLNRQPWSGTGSLRTGSSSVLPMDPYFRSFLNSNLRRKLLLSLAYGPHSYFGNRMSLYVYASGAPSNFVEPFSLTLSTNETGEGPDFTLDLLSTSATASYSKTWGSNGSIEIYAEASMDPGKAFLKNPNLENLNGSLSLGFSWEAKTSGGLRFESSIGVNHEIKEDTHSLDFDTSVTYEFEVLGGIPVEIGVQAVLRTCDSADKSDKNFTLEVYAIPSANGALKLGMKF